MEKFVYSEEKNSHLIVAEHPKDHLTEWLLVYLHAHVKGAPRKTQEAKVRDLNAFVQFVMKKVGHEHVDAWTPVLTKAFQNHLMKTVSAKTQKAYAATTINRILASLKHFGRWLHQERPLPAGGPFKGIKDLQIDEPAWKGLTSNQILLLKSACEQRIKNCRRKDQNPRLEAAVFYVLLQTGLRESEVVSLNVGQYHHQGFHNVIRYRNKRISKKVTLPQDSREFLEQYLATRKIVKSEDPLFVSRYGKRLHVQDVRRLCSRLLKQASLFSKAENSFKFTPHMLRHTFLKKVSDKHGVHVAQQLSGNVSIREIFRYAKPSQEEMDKAVEELFS